MMELMFQGQSKEIYGYFESDSALTNMPNIFTRTKYFMVFDPKTVMSKSIFNLID